MDNWGPYYIERVKAELDGTWKSEDFWGGLKSKLVVMAPYTNMPDDVKKLAEETEAAITEGKLRGDEITFKAGTTTYTGRVSGNTIKGTSPNGWSATK